MRALTSRLRGRTSSRARQRLLAGVVTVGFGSALLLGPADPGQRSADAAKPPTPYACGGHRAQIPLSTGHATATAGAVTPCLSGVEAEFSVGHATGPADVAVITNITKVDPQPVTVPTADGSTLSGLFHIAFSDFTVSPDEQTQITTIGGTSPNVPYGFTLRPGGNPAPVIGAGSGVVTDMLVTGDSHVRIDLSHLSLLGLNLPLSLAAPAACTLAGGPTPSGPGSSFTDCDVTIAQLNGDLINLITLAGGNRFGLKLVDLKFYYLVTHDASGQAAPGTALQFPDATIAVTP